MFRRSIVAFWVFVGICVGSSAWAYSQSVTEGLNWLGASQTIDGAWSGAETPDFIASSAATDALSLLSPENPGYGKSLQWLKSQSVSPTDFLARRIIALARDGQDTTAEVETLLANRDENGGWGGGGGYLFNILDTALALQALHAVAYNDTSFLGTSLNYLTRAQNDDGGFGFYPGAPKSTYMTALVVNTLCLFEKTFPVRHVIDKGVAYLLTKQNADGGFGSSPSTVHETALTLEALIASGSVAEAGSQAGLESLQYLAGSQRENGSWNDAPYSTALALQALAAAKPDLVLKTGDIFVSTTSPLEGESLTVTATVRNLGLETVESAPVRLHDGDTFVAEQTVADLGPGATAEVSFTIAALSPAGEHNLAVTLDGDDAVAEIDEANNTGAFRLWALDKPDLVILPEYLLFEPSLPASSEPVTLTAWIGNLGETPVGQVDVALYDGDPQGGGTQLGTFTVNGILAGGVAGGSLEFTLDEPGEHTLFAVVDSLGVIAEKKESNNTAYKPLVVGASGGAADTDLLIAPGGIEISNARPANGESVTVTLQALNLGPESATAALELYDGQPGAGGVLLHKSDIDLNAGETRTVTVPWQVGEGIHTLYAYIDRNNRVVEIDEANNRAELTVMADMVDISVSASDIAIEPGQPMAGDPATVTVTVRNHGILPTGAFNVTLYNGDPDNGGMLLTTFAVFDLSGDGAQEFSYAFTAARGDYRFHAVCDPEDRVAEFFEGNNTAIRSLSVKTSEEALGPDLVPVELDLSGTEQDPQSLRISGTALVKVQNQGDDKVVDPFRIVVFEDRDNDGLYTASIDVALGTWDYTAPMFPNGVALAMVPLDGTLTFRDAPIYVMADSGQTVFEQNEENNSLRRGSACEARPVVPIDPVMEWSWKENANVNGFITPSPVIVNLTDDNGDGMVDDRDVPDVVFVATKYVQSPFNGALIAQGELWALSGESGQEIFSYFSLDHPIAPGTLSFLAAGDIDQDGLPELVVPRSNSDGSYGLLLFENDGTLKWDNSPLVDQWRLATGTAWLPNYIGATPSIADIDADGRPEIVCGATVTNPDGSIRWVASGGNSPSFPGTGVWSWDARFNSVVADLDLDGQSEIVGGNTAYDVEGRIKWWNQTVTDGLTAIGNLDEDQYPEIVLLTGVAQIQHPRSGRLYVLEHDGTVKFGPIYLTELEQTTTQGQGSPPVIADFDGDGEPEIGVKGNLQFLVLGKNGNLKYAIDLPYIFDGTFNAPAVFDLNGDGRQEIIFNNEHYFRIFDGKDGTLVHQEPFGGWTWYQNVTVADVDNDGQAEIIATGFGFDGSFDKIRVYGAKNRDWVDARGIWNQPSYHVTNVNDDGTIPRYEAPSWLINNNYRVNVPISASQQSPYLAADVSASLARVNMADYPSSVSVSVRIGNGGAKAVEAGVPVTIYDGDPQADGVLIGTSVTSRELLPGDYEDVAVVWNTPPRGERTLFVLADADVSGVGVIEECDEENNEHSLVAYIGEKLPVVDLTIPPGGIKLSNFRPSSGETVTVTVHATNLGPDSATTDLSLYDGLPAAGGSLIGSGTLTLTAGETGSLEIPWQAGEGSHTLYAYVDRSDLVIETDETNNRAELTVMADMVDIEVSASDIRIEPSQPMDGDPAAVTVTVHNRGVRATGPFSVALYNGDPAAGGTLLQSFAVADLPGDGAQTLTHNFTAERGDYRFHAICDDTNQVTELYEGNNTAIRSLSVKTSEEALGPDLVPVELDLSGTEQDPQSLRISGTALVKVQNQGDDKVIEPYRIVVFEDRDSDGLYTASKDTTLGEWDYALPMFPNGVALAMVPLDGTLTFRDAPIYAMADSGQTVFEQNEENNTLRRGFDCGARPANPIEPVVEWHWQNRGCKGAAYGPIVVNLTDDNGDGKADEKDNPDIIFLTPAASHPWCGPGAIGDLHVVDGTTGEEILYIASDPAHSFYAGAEVAAGDINNDGFPEIVLPGAGSGHHGLLCFSHEGVLLWDNYQNGMDYSVQHPGFNGLMHEGTAPVIADIDSDGQPEIIGDDVVVNADGSIKLVLNQYNRFGDGLHFKTSVVDLDLDGAQEILYGNGAYRNDGTLLWSNGLNSGFSIIGNLDEDAYPEIVFLSDNPVGTRYNLLYVLEHDGSIKWGPINLHDLQSDKSVFYRGGLPTLADFDGDEEPEIGLKIFDKYLIFDRNGNVKKEISIAPGDNSDIAATVFDLNGDKRPEILIHHSDYFSIFDGKDGNLIYQEEFGARSNDYQNVVVADVDNDNQAEIVVAGGDGGWYWIPAQNGIKVYGSSNGSWVSTRRIWNQRAYYVTNINEDGSVPKHEAPSWLLNNTYHCNLPIADAASNVSSFSDISASFARVALADYPPAATITARIGNGGAVAIEPGISVAFYDGEPASGGMLIGTAATTRNLLPGEYEDVALVWSAPAEGRHTLFIRADSGADGNGSVEECDEANNETTLDIALTSGGSVPAGLPDLSVVPEEMVLPPDMPEGSLAEVGLTVRNLGTEAAENAVLRLFVGDPARGGRQIGGDRTIAQLGAGEAATVTIPWNTLGYLGLNYLYAVVDPDDALTETNEGNNTALRAVEVGAALKPDLQIESGDFSIVPAAPAEGDPLTITATLHNRGTAVGDVKVVLYDGDPAVGGVALGEATVAQLIPLGGSATVTFRLESIGLSGSRNLVVALDPANAIEESAENNNQASRAVSISSAALNLVLTSDKTQYGANEDALFTLRVSDLGAGDRTLAYDLQIRDKTGQQVAFVAKNVLFQLGAAATVDIPVSWNTGTTLGGEYLLAVSLKEGDKTAARASTPITIVANKAVRVSVATDKGAYPANEIAGIAITIASESPNYIFSDLSARVSVVDAAGTEVFGVRRPVPLLPPGQSMQLQAYWNTADRSKGIYIARLELSEGEVLLESAQREFEVLGSADTGAGITGTLAMEPGVIEYGESGQLAFTVRNLGNEELSGHSFSLLIVDPETKKVVRTIGGTSRPPLPMDGLQAEAVVLETTGLGLKNYLAILQLESGDLQLSLAGAAFRVKDETPPALAVLSPAAGETYRTGVPITVQASDAATGIEKVEYRLDDQESWTALSLFDSSADIYSALWETTFEDDGEHALVVRAFDKAGNQSVAAPVAFEVLTDFTPPETQLEIGEPHFQASDGPMYVTAATPFTLSATDDLSGVQATSYRFDEEATWRVYDGSFRLAELDFGAHTIHFLSLDKAGNQEAEKSVEVTLIGIEVDAEILNPPRVLVWTGEPAKKKGKNYNLDDIRALAAEALASPEAYFKLTTDKVEFQDEFNSGFYNMVFILDQDVPFNAPFLREIRRAVSNGMGLLVAGWGNNVHPILQEALGVDFRGSLPMADEEHALYLFPGALSDGQTLLAKGRVLRTRLDGGDLAGVVVGENACNGIRKVTFNYPVELTTGDLVTAALYQEQNGVVRLIDEEQHAIDSLPAVPACVVSGDPSGDVSIDTITSDGAAVSISAPFGHLGDNYSLSVTVDRPDGSSITTGAVSFHPVCSANLQSGVLIGPFRIEAMDEGNVTGRENVPAIVLGRYGRGKTMFLSYNIVESALHGHREEQSGLLRRAAGYLLPELDLRSPGSLMLVATRVRAHGAGLDLDAVDSLGEGLIHRPIFGLDQDFLEYRFQLQGGEEYTYRYFVQADETITEYGKTTALYLLLSEESFLFGRYPYSLSSSMAGP